MKLKEFLKYINVWEFVNIYISNKYECKLYNVSISNKDLIQYYGYYVDSISSVIDNNCTDRPLTTSISIWISKKNPHKELIK